MGNSTTATVFGRCYFFFPEWTFEPGLGYHEKQGEQLEGLLWITRDDRARD